MKQHTIVNLNLAVSSQQNPGLAGIHFHPVLVCARGAFTKAQAGVLRAMGLGFSVVAMVGVTAGSALAQGTWSETGPLPGSPYATMVVGLATGDALLSGGLYGGLGAVSAGATVYRPVTNAWTGTTAMKYRRHSHTGTLLEDGTALVVGGGVWDGVRYTFAPKAETYKPATKTWTATGTMITPRFGHTATKLADGRVLVTGGANFYYPRNNRIAYTATAEIYDPNTRKWASAGSMSMARINHSATLLPDGKLLAAGGSGINYNTSATEIFDPATGKWSLGPSMQSVTGGNWGGALSDGRVLVVGYNGYAEVYDPVSRQWSLTAMPASAGPLARLADGNLLLVAPSPAPCLIYHASTNTWSPTGALTFSRASGALATLATGQVLLAGGYPIGTYGGELYTP